MIPLRHLQQLRALERHGSFRAAAVALGLSQPALSRSLQALEESIGCALIDRQRPRVVPTPAGKLVLERAGELLRAARRLESDLDDFLGRETGELVAGIGTYPAEFLLPQALRRLRLAHPGIRIRLVIEAYTDLLPRLRDGEAELAVINIDGLESSDELDVRALRPREGVVFCRADHALARDPKPTFEKMRAYPMACPRLPEPVQRVLGRPGDPEIECNSISAIKAIVGATDALGVVAPESLTEKDTWSVLPPGRGVLRGRFGIVTRSRVTLSPAAAAFTEMLLEADRAVD